MGGARVNKEITYFARLSFSFYDFKCPHINIHYALECLNRAIYEKLRFE